MSDERDKVDRFLRIVTGEELGKPLPAARPDHGRGRLTIYTVLDLVCAHAPPGADGSDDTEHTGTFTASTHARAKRLARAVGWQIGARILCPTCAAGEGAGNG